MEAFFSCKAMITFFPYLTMCQLPAKHDIRGLLIMRYAVSFADILVSVVSQEKQCIYKRACISQFGCGRDPVCDDCAGPDKTRLIA